MHPNTLSAFGVWLRFYPASIIRLFAWVLVLFAFAPGFSDGIAHPGPDPELERLTQTLAVLHTRYQLALPTERAALLGQLQGIAAERRERLASIIGNDPGEVLRVALPRGRRAALPGAVQSYVEEEADLQGEIETLHVDFKDPRQSHYRYFLKTKAGERISLHFTAHAPEVLTGTKIRALGVLIKGAGPMDLGKTAGAMAVQDGATNLETLALSGTTSSTTSIMALPNTFGA